MLLASTACYAVMRSKVFKRLDFVETRDNTPILVCLWILYAMHLNDNPLFCVFDVICSPNSRLHRDDGFNLVSLTVLEFGIPTLH
jgi:hypothetical protein